MDTQSLLVDTALTSLLYYFFSNCQCEKKNKPKTVHAVEKKISQVKTGGLKTYQTGIDFKLTVSN